MKLFRILVAILLVFSMISCSVITEDLQKPTDVSTGNVVDSSQNNTTVSQATTETKDATIEEVVILDEMGVKITAKKLEDDSFFGPELKLLIENNSDKNLTVQCRNASVNGYMVDTMMSADIVAGKKVNDSITFTNLDECGITTIADMEFSFHIFTSDDWETYLDSDVVSIKTSAADTYDYKYDDSGDIAYEGNDIKVVVKGLSDASYMGPSIVVYIENNGNKNVTIQTRDVSINGFMVDAIFSSDVLVGKRAVDTITFLSSDLEENEIEEISDIELSFHIFNMDNWNTIADTEVVKITF